ncbi:MAG: DUF6932 family protein [Thermoleophilia bacterium]
MIPDLNHSGVLPPFLPSTGPTVAASMAPYSAGLVEIVERFGHTDVRANLIRGLIDYRKLLREMGIINGFQWIDGSFVEECETHRRRPPSDIDLVTFAERPSGYQNPSDWQDFFNQNIGIFKPDEMKIKYSCDAYYEDLDLPGQIIVKRASYWFGLLSHQRESFLWKGLLAVPLKADDDAALDILNRE